MTPAAAARGDANTLRLRLGRAFLLAAVLLALGIWASGCARRTSEPEPPKVATETPPPAAEEPTPSPAPTLAPGEWPKIDLELLADGLDQPLDLTHAGDGSGRLYVAEKTGRIKVIDNGKVLPTAFLDISKLVSRGSEQGLLGLAFPVPQSASMGGTAPRRRFYVNYTDRNGDTIVARYAIRGDGNADPASAKTVLKVSQPYANHNGGGIAFGPDGYLYIGMGDGGSGGDPQGNGQKLGTLLGKMLRIDVEGSGGAVPNTYRVPSDNPFTNTRGAKREIWAYGLRNPWRFSFDRVTGDMWIGDVGQNEWEEIDLLPSGVGGKNFGWALFEGDHPYPPRAKRSKPKAYLAPVVEYGHDAGTSVTGGFIYRGSRYPNLRGIYLYADFTTGRIWGLRRTGAAWENKELADTDMLVASFGEDEDGTLYVCDLGGAVYRVTAR